MESLSEKDLKDKMNESLLSSQSSEEEIEIGQCELEELSDRPAEGSSYKKSVEKIQDVFRKTEAIKEAAKENNQQVEAQFKELRDKLSTSSEYLLRIKKNIDNLKFSYQKNVLELHNKLDPGSCLEPGSDFSKEDMARHMEDIRKKIEDLQGRMTEQKEKQHQVTESYKEAFDRVMNSFEEIESGSYSSQNLLEK